MLIDDACRDLKLPAFRNRFIEPAATALREQPPTSSSSSTCCGSNSLKRTPAAARPS
ncbi:hypothetical protein OHV05_38035 (plasmid) [Kitasatospora sp. NBC_00070]|uniref:hypothetical protein n=1 Tax=Kitasatospora sp. NBC_00070 TaxID=2975962 RepID=UPI002F912925